jgi:spore germination protein
VRRAGAVIAACVVGAALVLAGVSPASGAPLVTGYADDGTTAHQITASSAALTTVAVDGVNLTSDGAHISSVSREQLATLVAAHHRHKRAELLLGNFDETIDDFSPTLGARMLRSSARRAAVVAALADEVTRHHWDGITVDLESLTAADAPGLTAFVRALHLALGSRITVAVALMATTGSYRSLGYDVPALARSADRLVLMGYDQHGPWSGSGPIGGMPWVKKVLARLLRSAPPSKVELGIATYGYAWPGDSISPHKARSMVRHDGARAVWSSKQLEWHATLHDGTVLWWSDERSFRARYALASRMHLHGVAVWSLSQADPIRR